MKKSKFIRGQLVWVTFDCINDRTKMIASIPYKYFELDTAYVVEDIGKYSNIDNEDHWRILVGGSSQFVHEDCFTDAVPKVKNSKKKRKYETIKIDGSEFYLIPK